VVDGSVEHFTVSDLGTTLAVNPPLPLLLMVSGVS